MNLRRFRDRLEAAAYNKYSVIYVILFIGVSLMAGLSFGLLVGFVYIYGLRKYVKPDPDVLGVIKAVHYVGLAYLVLSNPLLMWVFIILLCFMAGFLVFTRRGRSLWNIRSMIE